MGKETKILLAFTTCYLILIAGYPFNKEFDSPPLFMAIMIFLFAAIMNALHKNDNKKISIHSFLTIYIFNFVTLYAYYFFSININTEVLIIVLNTIYASVVFIFLFSLIAALLLSIKMSLEFENGAYDHVISVFRNFGFCLLILILIICLSSKKVSVFEVFRITSLYSIIISFYMLDFFGNEKIDKKVTIEIISMITELISSIISILMLFM